MSDNTWSDITVKGSNQEQEKVEYEIEGQEEEQKPVAVSPEPEQKEEVVETASEESSWIEASEEAEEKKEEPKELEGVETKGAQKRIRQLVKQRKERDEQIQKLIEQNETLSSKILEREKEFTQAQTVSTETSEKQLKDRFELAKSNYVEAYQSGDAEKVLQAQQALNQSQLDLQNIESTKVALNKYKEAVAEQEEIQKAAPQHQQPKADPKAIAWASDNEWFGKDTVMTAAALAIDGELKNLGLNPTDDEFYGEVDKRIRKEFPHKFTEEVVVTEQQIRQQPTKQAAQVVAGGSRSPATSGKKIKLTQEDMQLAAKWKIPLEMYAAEKMKVTQSDGGYTDVVTKRGG